MNVALVGCGGAGARRAQALGNARLVACADPDTARAAALARGHPGARACADWREALLQPGVELAIVSTPHDALAEVALAAVRAGKHVLIEKPCARRAAELEPVAEAAVRAGVFVRAGYNHRQHPALRKAYELARADAVGELLYVRARYGHGGRLGYEKEWRARPEVSGGGELLDQGVHLIDLARWFLGDFSAVQGWTPTYFWAMPVEDNAFLMLRTARGQAAFLHASWTEWKNLFSFEIFGRAGKLEIAGLGGSYGVERLTHYRMKPELGVPEMETWEFPGPDGSWAAELAEFLEDIRLRRAPRPGLEDALAALRIVERVYGETGR